MSKRRSQRKQQRRRDTAGSSQVWPRFHPSWIDVLSVIVIVVGWWYVLAGPAPLSKPPAVDLPAMQMARDETGAPVARLDYASWRDACRHAGLPDPPDLNGADPVPVQVILNTVEEWIRTREPAHLGRLGKIYLALDVNQTSLECFAAAAQLDPGEVRWQYYLGVQSQALGRDRQAIDVLEQTLHVDPEYATTYARLGLLHLHQGNLDRAQHNYEHYRRRRPHESLGYIGLGRVALSRNDPVHAEQLLRTAVERTPNDFLAYRFLARALALNGKEDEATEASAMSVRLPEYRGWLMFDDRLKDAHRIANTQRYLENELRLALGAQRHSDGIAIAQQLLDRRPADADMTGLLASLYHMSGQHEQARHTIDRAVQLAPESIPLHVQQAEIIFAQQDFVAAGAAIDALLHLDRDSARGHDLRGRLLYTQGDVVGAIEQVRRAVTLDPHGRHGRESRMLLVGMLTEAGLLDQARSELDAMLRNDPADEWARRRRQQLSEPD